jgi:flagellar biosynthesis/type III secretory pathway chaperone
MILMIAVSVCGWAQSQPQSQDNLVDRVSRVVGVRLPDGYEAKVKEFVTKSKVLEGIGGEFTETWIAGQMKTSWGIDKGNQLLFVWDAVYEQITKKNFYDGEDGNKKRLDEFEKVMDNIEACGKKFKEDYTAHMKQRSAEADRRSAEAVREIIKNTYDILKQLTEYHRLYKKDPSTAMPNEISQMKNSAIEIIEICQKYNIDYKAELRKELGDDRKVAELLKFYGVE